MSVITVNTSLRKKKRELKNALGDDILRYIVELVTNSDDSYKRLGDNINTKKIIEINLQKDKKHPGDYVLSVTDNAEGMSLDRLEKVFGTYGEDNSSGIDSHARGIFGQGASDVLQASAYEKRIAKIESIKDGEISKLTYKMDDNMNATIETENIDLSGNRLQQYRQNLKIFNNGTRITFGIPSSVKINNKIIKNLPESINKYYAFRYLLNQNDVYVTLSYDNENYNLSSHKYQLKQENILLDEDFSFLFDGKNVNCNLKLYKNDNKKDDNTNIIVRDENFVIYDNTMFDFQNNSSAQNISGELVINGLYKICYEHLNSENPDAIINDNRTGFDTKNLFYISLNKSINPYIENILKENGKNIKITNLSNNKKFNDALKKLNKYLKSELKDTIGGGNLNGKIPPIEGLKFVRNNISITKEKQYDLKLLINSNIISVSEPINIVCDNENIDFSPSVIKYSEEEIEDGLVIKNVTIKALDLTDDSAIMQAKTANITTAVAIDVINVNIHYPENGLEFYPNDMVLTEGKIHFAKLYVDSDVVPLDSEIFISCDGLDCNSSIKFTSEALINENIGELNVMLEGGIQGNLYIVIAKYSNLMAKANLTIIEGGKNLPQNGGLIAGFKLEANDMFFQSYFNTHDHYIYINSQNYINQQMIGEMSDKDPENPKFSNQQSKYLCDIISNEAAKLLVKQRNIKHGEVNFDDYENAVDEVQKLIEQEKNKIFKEIYFSIMGISEEKKTNTE